MANEIKPHPTLKFVTKVAMNEEEKQQQANDIFERVNNVTFKTLDEISQIHKQMGLIVSTDDPVENYYYYFDGSDYVKGNVFSPAAIVDGSIITKMIADGAVTPEKTSFTKETYNLVDIPDITFERTETITLNKYLPAGDYNISAEIISSDIDSNDNIIVISSDRGEGSYTAYFTRGGYSYSKYSKNIPFEFNKITFYAGDNYGHSAGDTATFKKIMITSGTGQKSYIAPFRLNHNKLLLDEDDPSLTKLVTPEKTSFIKISSNLFNTEWEQGAIGSNGLPSGSPRRIRSKNFISIEEKQKISINCKEQDISFGVYCYNADEKPINYCEPEYGAKTYTTLEGTKYIKLYAKNLANTNFTPDYVHETMLNLGEPLPYENPFSPTLNSDVVKLDENDPAFNHIKENSNSIDNLKEVLNIDKVFITKTNQKNGAYFYMNKEIKVGKKYRAKLETNDDNFVLNIVLRHNFGDPNLYYSTIKLTKVNSELEFFSMEDKTNNTYCEVLFSTGNNVTFNLIFENINEIEGLKERELIPFDSNSLIKSINHRGDNRNAPENTIPAFELSYLKGYKYIETDVEFTKDGIPVMLHDRTIDRTSNGTGDITTLTFKQVRQYDFGSWKDPKYIGTKIPSLDEFLNFCKNYGIHPYLECKFSYTEERVTKLLEVVNKYGMLKKVSFISFNTDILTSIANKVKGVRLGVLEDPMTNEGVDFAISIKNNGNIVFMDISVDHLDNILISKSITNDISVEGWTKNNTNMTGLEAFTGLTTDVRRFWIDLVKKD